MLDLDTKDWVQICCVENDELCFTKEYLSLTSSLGWGARKFAAHLITHWTKNFENTLDYFGPTDSEEDLYSGIDGEPMGISELIGDQFENNSILFDGLDSEWYRDIITAKLITLRLPKKLIEQYVKVAVKK